MAPGARAGRRCALSAPPGLSLVGSLLPGWRPAAFRERPELPGIRRDANSRGCTHITAPPHRPHHCLQEEQKVGAAGGKPLPAQRSGGRRAAGAAERGDGR